MSIFSLAQTGDILRRDREGQKRGGIYIYIYIYIIGVKGEKVYSVYITKGRE